MDEHAVARLLASLEQGDSPLVAMQELLSVDDEQLLALVCVPRRIDEHVLGALGLDPAATLEHLRGLALVNRVPGREDEYTLDDSVREFHYRRRWSPVPGRGSTPELAEISERLCACYEQAGDALEALYHRFAFDQDAAFEEFHELYREADERFDLPRCRDLLDVLEPRLPELPPWALTLWDEHRAYINARGVWVDDWYRSARFLVPEASRAPIEGLLDGTTGRCLQLWAAGGLGKTTHIRWLISRRCVPKPERIACARVDFDMIVAAEAVEEPWIALLELAEQLNGQLPETPFARLLKQFGEHRQRLRQGSDPVEGLVLPGSRHDDHAHHDEVVNGFRECMAALGSDERVVIVLDTLEVPLLIGQRPGGRSPLHGLLRDLSGAYAAAPSLRVVLAGRLDLRERVEGFATMFPDCRTLRLTGFSEPERRRYLVENRGLTDDAIVRAASRAAGRTPFKLALIADVVEQRPDLSAADIESYTDVDLLYLIKRVVERIDDPLTRWVLRYGVIPRKLDVTFVAGVMLPFVAEAAAGGRADDRPADDELPDRAAGDEQPWLSGVLPPGGGLDAEDLWNRLLRYAGGASWVNVEHAAGGEVLRFHPDVLDPMRRLLAGKDVFAALQRAACAFFEQRAADDPSSSARWHADAVFHRFHLDGPAAAGYWRALIRAASGPDQAERRKRLARDLIDGDYTDDDGEPLLIREGMALISRETLDEARFELAWAITQHARHERRPETSSHWSEAQALIRQVSHALESDVTVVDADRYAMALGALLFSTGSLDAACGHVDAALRSQLDLADRLWLVGEYADALAAGGRADEAEARYRQALDLAGPTGAGRDRILSQLVRLSWDQDRLDDALGWAQQAVDAAGTAPTPELRTLMAAAQLGSGQSALALETIDEIEEAGDDVLVRGQLIRARAALQGWRPALGLALADRVLSRLRAAPPGSERGRLIAQATELRGAACAALLDVEGAMAAFGETAEQCRVAGVLAGVCRAHVRRADLLRELGDLAGADRELSYADKMGLRSARDRSPLVRLRAEVAGRRGKRDAARALVDEELASMRARGAAPHELVAALLTGLAVEDGDASGLLSDLADVLAEVTPPARRLALLTALRRCPPAVAVPEHLRERVRAVVPSACDGDLPQLRAEDAATLTLADAELDRVLGWPERARRKLRTVAGALGDGDAAGLCEWLEAWYRAGGDDPEAEAGLQLRQALDASVGRPLQHAALSILIASGRAGDEEPDRLCGASLLDRASDVLGGQRSAGRWQALLQTGLAGLARARGDDGLERTRTLLAADIYRRLGDDAAREEALSRIGASPAREQIADGLLTISLTKGRQRINAKLARGADVVRVRGDRDNRVVRALFGGADDVTQFSPATAAIVAGDIADLARDLADVIVGRDGGARSQLRAPGEARLRIPDLALHHLPWEVAVVCDPRLRPLVDDGGPWLRSTLDERLGSEEVRELQSSLDPHVPATVATDGILGPASREALERFQRAAGLPVTGTPDHETQHHLLAAATTRRAVVVRAATGPEARGSLDLRQTREPVERVYRRHGFETEVIEGLTLAGLRRMSATQPALIHLSGAFVEYQGTAVLDLAGEWEYVENPRTSAESERITPSALSRALHAADARPIVILDPPAPRSRYELALQLMLRNGFAGDLFAHGEVRAVLGLGLARHEAQEEQYELVVGQLAASVALGSLIRRVHDRSQSPALRRSGHELAFASAALFARSGEIRPPWRH